MSAEHDVTARGERPPTFERVYREHYAFVWKSVRRLGVLAAEADDLVQEVFVVVHRRLADFEGRSSITTWLFSIAYRVVRDFRRKQAAAKRREELASGPRPRTSPTRGLRRRRAVDLLDRLLGELDDDKRDAFVMSEILHMKVPEIADTLGVNVNTVYSRVRAARARFEQALARETPDANQDLGDE